MSSFNAELLKLRPYLLKLAMHYARKKDKAEDLVQDTMLRALRFQHRYQPNTNFTAWVSTILVRVFYSKHRRGKLELAYLEKVRSQGNQEIDRYSKEQVTDPAEAGWKDTLDDNAVAALDSLSDDHRTVVVLSDLHGASYREIADAIGCPTGTVMSRLHRARHNFKKAYSR